LFSMTPLPGVIELHRLRKWLGSSDATKSDEAFTKSLQILKQFSRLCHHASDSELTQKPDKAGAAPSADARVAAPAAQVGAGP
jgi:hypothetical protein